MLIWSLQILQSRLTIISRFSRRGRCSRSSRSRGITGVVSSPTKMEYCPRPHPKAFLLVLSVTVLAGAVPASGPAAGSWPGPGRLRGRRLVANLAPTGGAFRRAKELEVLAHDFELAAFLPGLLVVPLVEPQSPFDEDRPSFRHVLADRFRLASPNVHVHKSDF